MKVVEQLGVCAAQVQGYVTNFQNLASLIKTLKDVGLKKFAIEKDSFENSISSIRLITFNYAITTAANPFPTGFGRA